MLLLEAVGQLLGDGGDLAVERPEAITMKSPISERPRRSMVTMSSALSSSRESIDDAEEVLAGQLASGPGTVGCGSGRVGVG
jgi:hypothetical protein